MPPGLSPFADAACAGAGRAVLVTGARAPVALDCARAFRTAGWRVHLADSVAPFAARWSRPRWRVHRFAPPRRAFSRFRADLKALVETHAIDLVVPTCEEVFYVSAAATLDGYASHVFAPPPETLRRLHSKHDFPALLTNLGIEAPDTRRLVSPADLEGLDLPRIVLKPEFSRFAVSALVAPTRARAARVRPSPEAPWVAQRLVVGQEICLWSAARDGRLAALAVYRPRRRHGRSASYLFEAVDCPPAVSVAERIAAALHLTGHLSLDLILTPDGRALPIECNPRAVSGLHLLDAEPALARAIAGDGEGLLAPPAGRLRHLVPAMALLGLPAAYLAGEAAALRAEWRASRDAVGRGGDRGAVLGCLADAARFALLGLSRRRSPAGETTDDIEWNGGPIG